MNPPVTPPDPDAVAAMRALTDEMQSAWESQSEARAAVLVLGPDLTDPDAARDCRCSCHPRPAELGLHDGGASCPCQLSADERRERTEQALAALADDPLNAALDAQRDEFATVAARLGVDATLECTACPVGVSGNVDGVAFYARERHDSYRVVVDPDGLIEDLHTHSPGAVLVAAGDTDEFADPMSPALLLDVAVDAARTFARRRGCSHGRNPEGARWCCDCGLALDIAD